MSKKKTWKGHALDLIREQDKCPGDVPPTGGMDDKLSQQEFLAMAQASGVHTWDSCHYVEEILGLPPEDGMRELPVSGDRKALLKSLDNLVKPMNEVNQSKKLAEFKQRLHQYVDRIVMKGDNIQIPSQLLNLVDYADKFFN